MKARKSVHVAKPGVVIDQGNALVSVAEIKRTKSSNKRARVKIGDVYITSDKASADQIKHSVSISADMLQRLGQKISRPGVRIKSARNIPLFSIDPERPDRILRKMNGKTERGILENGIFRVID